MFGAYSKIFAVIYQINPGRKKKTQYVGATAVYRFNHHAVNRCLTFKKELFEKLCSKVIDLECWELYGSKHTSQTVYFDFPIAPRPEYISCFSCAVAAALL